MIRVQLEAADLLQGFKVLADSNSGFGSLAQQVVTYFLKDEAPKAPVYLFSVNNQYQFEESEGLSEEEATNLETRKELIALNQSLSLSETLENIELVIPLDTIKVGKQLEKYLASYDSNLLFHQSALQSLVYQNIYDVIQKRSTEQCYDMRVFYKEALYAGSGSNILIPQLQAPIYHHCDQRFLEKVEANHLSDPEYFIGFNELSEISDKRLPIRHSYIVRGS